MAKLEWREGRFLLTRESGPSEEIHLREAVKWRISDSAAASPNAAKIIERATPRYYNEIPDYFPHYLDPHQEAGVRWILSRARSYLAHAPGAGKTCEAITASLYMGVWDAIIFIVPPSLTENWRREIVKWTAEFSDGESISDIHTVTGRGPNRWSAEYLIVPDSLLHRPEILFPLLRLEKSFIAVDEASRFKDPTSQRAIALFGGRFKNGQTTPGLIHDARHVVLLDGSPMPNRPMELWAPTYAMCPSAINYMDREEFGHRYCGPTTNNYGRTEFNHSSNEAELKAALQKNFMHVVGEEELHHPERKRSLLFITKDVRTPEIKTWERKHLTKIRFDEISEDASRGELATMRLALGLRKVTWTAEYVRDRLKDANEAILLFCWHKEVAIELYARLEEFTPFEVTGDTAMTDREKIFSSFQSGGIQLIIGNILAMGRGHNLQRADRVVFAEWSWSDEWNKQAEKRASRKGRDADRPVRAEYIVAPSSLDEPILSAVMRKAARVKKIIG